MIDRDHQLPVARVTPAMAAGLTDKLMDMADVAAMIDAESPPKKRGPYQKREAVA